jgi:hypothetical protein
MEELLRKDELTSSARVDLHTHTTYSDGANTPQQLVQKASEKGIQVIAIADHDNVGALVEAAEWGKHYDVEILAGLELSVSLGEKDVHILAYLFDPTNERLLDYLKFFRLERRKRAERMVDKLNSLGIPLKMDSVLEKAGVGSIGRPHVANAMVDEGLVASYQEVFEKYIGNGMPAYEKKYQVTPTDAAKLISQAGGLSFIAHPGKHTTEPEIDQLINSGIDGIEVVHPSHNPARQEYFRSVVNQYFLLECGGSDYHGGKKNDDYAFGAFTVPLRVVEAMKSRLFL